MSCIYTGSQARHRNKPFSRCWSKYRCLRALDDCLDNLYMAERVYIELNYSFVYNCLFSHETSFKINRPDHIELYLPRVYC